MKVAIDGPAGAGKSSVAKAIAQQCGFMFLDTGAMYRSVALCALEEGADLSDAEALVRIAKSIRIEFQPDANPGVVQRVIVNGRDVTNDIRTPRVDETVSIVSSVSGVREAMLVFQRSLADHNDVVAEGRDIGTVVFPDAEVKVFLTADAMARARRRVAQNAERFCSDGQAPTLEEVYQAILKRDEADSNREIAPLMAAEDAVRIDSSDKSQEDVVNLVKDLIEQVKNNEKGYR